MNICCILSILLDFFIFMKVLYFIHVISFSPHNNQPDEVSVISILPSSSCPGAYMLVRADRRETDKQINIYN